MVTIKEVSKLAGVSISTTSYALNNDPRVKESTRKKVLEAAKKLNYTPNGSARNLKRKSTNTIGVFLDGFSRPTYHKLLDGINIELIKLGYSIIVSSGKSAERLLLERQVDAAIIHDRTVSDEIIKRVASTNFPIVVLDRTLESKNIYGFMIENTEVTYKLTKLLIEKGYKDICFISGPITYDSLHRYKGFIRAMDEHDLNTDKYYRGDWTIESGYNIVKNVLKNQNVPEVFFCANDEMAIGVMDALKEYDYKIPDDVAVVGFDNIELAKYYTPSLTTIHIDRFLWGSDVARLVYALIKKEDDFSRFARPSGEIIIRNSL